MRYLLMIYGDEVAHANLSDADLKQEMDQYWAFTNEVNAAGVNQGGEALHMTSTATTVRVRNGKTMTSDGPFAETKEQLGGYYLLDVANLDEAIKWAAKIPGALSGSIEIRPIVEFG